jgi:putative DNA primase/helicase
VLLQIKLSKISLMAWPTSTMGTRLYKPGDLNNPALCAFDQRLRSLLEVPLPLDEDGALEPPILRLEPAAVEVWRQLHDDVERELGSRGEFSELPDFGAKIAEQGARVACVLHVFQNGPTGRIGQDTMLAGAKIALWHLHEARRVLGMVGHAGEAADAQLLLEWLTQRPEPATLRDIQRGLYRMHDKERRDRAVTMLVDHGLARVVKHGQSEKIVLNPAARP